MIFFPLVWRVMVSRGKVKNKQKLLYWLLIQLQLLPLSDYAFILSEHMHKKATSNI